MFDFASFPVELFQEISGLLSNTDRGALSGTCQFFRSLVAPELFRKLTIDFHDTSRARHQLQTLANPQATAHSLAGLFTKHLELRICNLEPLPEGVGGPWRFPEEAQRVREIEEFRGNLGSALVALKRCETLKVSADPGGRGNRIPAWFADILGTALASISTLKEIEFSYQWGFPPPAIVTANTVPGLQRYAMSADIASTGGAGCTPKFSAALLSSLDTAISGKLELRELKVNTGISGYHGQGVPTVGQLFGGACMSSSPPLHLLSLELDGWSVDKDALSIALPHLKDLRTFSLGSRIFGSVDLIWDTLSEASIFLKSLQTQNASTPALFRYLSSYQGLEGASLSPRVAFGTRSTSRDSMRLRDILNVLSNHKASLKRLDVASDSWGYCVDDAAALLQFAVLENLDIFVTASVLPQLMDVVFCLPCLAVLGLSSAIVSSWWGMGLMQVNHPMNILMGTWIGGFVIPTTAARSKIKDVRIIGGKSFRRRGDRLRFGTVEPDGKWREIGEDEMLDRRGWVVKRPPPPPLEGGVDLSPSQTLLYDPRYGYI